MSVAEQNQRYAEWIRVHENQPTPAYMRELPPMYFGTAQQEALARQQYRRQPTVAEAAKYALFTAGLITGVMCGVVGAFLIHGLL